MKTTAKRLLSLLLCAVMWFSCLGTAGVTAFEEDHDHDHVAEEAAANEVVSAAAATEDVTITVTRDPADGSFDSGHYCLAPTVSVTASEGHKIESVEVNGEKVEKYDSFKPAGNKSLPGAGVNVTVTVTYDTNKTKSLKFEFGHTLTGAESIYYTVGNCKVRCQVFNCTICGSQWGAVVTGGQHNYGEAITVGSCDGKSYEIQKCQDCGYCYRKEVKTENPGQATEHTWKTTPEAAVPECGKFSVKVETCEKCQDVRVTVTIGEHTYKDKGTVTAPTCTEKGKRVVECTTCHKTQEYTVSALGHDDNYYNKNKGKVTKEPDCQNDGEKTFTCSRCGATRTETIPKGAHKYTVSDDCTKGTYCEVCHTVIIEPTQGHNMKVRSDGKIEGHLRYCSNPGCNVSTREAHKFTSSYDPKTGNTLLYCDVCGFQTTEHTHEFECEWQPVEGKDYHQKKCKTCGAVVTEKHTVVDDGDCTTEVKCTVCGGVSVAARSTHEFTEVDYTQRNSDGHKLKCKYCTKFSNVIEHTPEKDDGDCTTAIKCTVCLYVITKGNDKHNSNGGKMEHDEKYHWMICANPGCTQVASEKHEHIVNDKLAATDCSEPEYCSVCHYLMRAAGDHDWEVIKDNEDGKHHVKCRLCKEEADVPHEFADDGNCTTADPCVCGALSEKKESHNYGGWKDIGASGHKGTCQNDGCTATTTEKHDSTNTTGDCTQPFTCSVCQHKSQGNTKHNWSTEATDKGNGHVYTCTNPGCKVESEVKAHVEKAGRYCTDDVVCRDCGKVLKEGAKEHKLECTTDTTRVDISEKHEVRCTNPGCTYIEGWKDHVSDNANETDCTKDSVCKDCGYVLVKGGKHPSFTVVGTAAGHVRTCTKCGYEEDLKPHRNPTYYDCTKEKRCVDCGYLLANQLNKEHKLVTTDDENGTTHTVTCEDCDYKKTYDHTYDPDRKCDENLVCTECGYVKEKAGEHTWGKAVDNGDGTHVYTCTVCGETLSEKHSGGTATCTEKAKCAICGASYGDVDKTNHTGVSDKWTSDGTSHWKVCSACGDKTNVSAHSGGKATCTKKAVCEVCGAEYGSVDKTQHTGIPIDWTSDETSHWKVCSDCGDRLHIAAHSGGTATCTEKAKCAVCGAEYGEVNKTNHTKLSNEWKHDSENHWKECSACGDQLEFAPHTYENGKCTVCGAADESYTPPATTDPTDTTAEPSDTTAEPVDTTEPADTTAEPSDTTEPADTTGSDEPPKTGDRDGALFIVLFAVSMAGAAVVVTGVVISRRREDR